MQSLCSELSLFLSNLNDHIYELSSNGCVQFIKNAANFQDINNFVFYGNIKIFLEVIFEEFIKQYYSIPQLKKSTGTFQASGSTTELSYTYTDYHFEFDYSEKYLEFIKTLTSNNTITKRQIIIFMKNVDSVPKSHQHALRRMLEKYQHVKFFMSSKTLSDLEPAIKSRSFLLNCAFPQNKIYNCLRGVCDTQMEEGKFAEMLKENNHNIISTIIYISNNFEKPKIEQNLISFLKNMTKERNPLNVIMTIRELCYKLFHLNVELPYVCNIVIGQFSAHKKIKDIIALSAEIDTQNCRSNKNLILYEKYLLEIYKIIKGI